MRKPRHQIVAGTHEHDLLREDHMAEPLEQAIWARFAEAAVRVGCPAEIAASYYDDILESYRPTEMQRDYRPSRIDVDDFGRLLYPEEPEEMRRQYRASLADVLGDLVDLVGLEATLKDLAQEWNEERGK